MFRKTLAWAAAGTVCFLGAASSVPAVAAGESAATSQVVLGEELKVVPASGVVSWNLAPSGLSLAASPEPGTLLVRDSQDNAVGMLVGGVIGAGGSVALHTQHHGTSIDVTAPAGSQAFLTYVSLDDPQDRYDTRAFHRGSKPFVSVPSHYVYDPSRGSLHDYCTMAADNWYRADFRGPCARHDLCYEAAGNGSKKHCQKPFHNNLNTNCRYAYSGFKLGVCKGVAWGYYLAVKANG